MQYRHGFTYLWLLFIVAAGAGGLAALGQRSSTATQREREAELAFRGRQIAQAIGAYREHTPGAVKELPQSLQDLVDDRRGPSPAHHLRRIYDDPFTAKPDWVLIVDEAGRIRGVHSRAAVPAMKAPAAAASARAGTTALVSDLKFVFEPRVAAPAEPASGHEP